MQEGERVCFEHENKNKCGKIIKIFTQIGFEDHGKKFVVIMPDNTMGLFESNNIIIEKRKLKIIN